MKMHTNFLPVFFLLMALQGYSQQWTTNFEEAKTTAQSQDKNILLVFSGSDWCVPCIKLEKNIFESTQFKEEAQANWILVKADFPKKKANAQSEEIKKQNALLSETYNREGNFPLVAVLDKNGKVLGMTGFKNIPPAEYITLLHALEKKR